jgi:hypothetical protein
MGGATHISHRVARSVRPPSLLACTVMLAALKIALRTIQFRRTLALIHRFAAPDRPVTEADTTAAGIVTRRVATAAAFYPGRAECLEQALALYALLRRRGIAAQLRLGVRPHRFAAHAWVEYGHEPLDEVVENLRDLVPVEGVSS